MIYISYSMSYHGYAQQVYDYLKNSGHNVCMWQPNTKYYSDTLLRSDVVVFVIKDFKFNSPYEALTPGVQKEILQAIYEKKDIKVAYINKQGVLKFYNGALGFNNKVLTFGGIVNSGDTNIKDCGVTILENDDDYLTLTIL